MIGGGSLGAKEPDGSFNDVGDVVGVDRLRDGCASPHTLAVIRYSGVSVTREGHRHSTRPTTVHWLRVAVDAAGTDCLRPSVLWSLHKGGPLQMP
jgi:hypothetical protein